MITIPTFFLYHFQKVMKKINKSKQTNKNPIIFVKTYGCMGLASEFDHLSEKKAGFNISI